jgi:hypothetical protein
METETGNPVSCLKELDSITNGGKPSIRECLCQTVRSFYFCVYKHVLYINSQKKTETNVITLMPALNLGACTGTRESLVSSIPFEFLSCECIFFFLVLGLELRAFPWSHFTSPFL